MDISVTEEEPKMPDVMTTADGRIMEWDGKRWGEVKKERTRNSKETIEEFLLLGHDRGVFYYLPKNSGQIVALTVSRHTEPEFIGLCPDENWWRKRYGNEEGISWKFARMDLISRQYKVGIYDPSRVRGCGAWWDTDHAVLHLGDRLIVSNQEAPLTTPGRFIYEKNLPIRINYKNPLSAREASNLIRICELASWEKPISAKYLAGWLALAPVCGALNWRPHIWCHGGSGAGKSWMFNNVVTPLIGSIAQPAQHSTTEAGLRQTLKHDAKPVIFDEADASKPKAQDRIDNVLELARAASTEGSPAIVKGNPDGNASTWRIRSAFSFWSVNYSAKLKQDENRITAMALIVRKDQVAFDAIKKLTADTINPEYADRFLARSIKMIPVIRENARIFAAASAPVLGTQRAGDQIGALLAGAYSLHSDTAITAAQAMAYIAKQDWTEQKTAATETDESKLFDLLMETIIKIGARDYSIGELVDIARKDLGDLETRAAHSALNMRGFRADPDCLVISISHIEVARILSKTEWAISWGKTLRRLTGAQDTTGPVRFGSTKSRGVEIPYPLDEDTDY
jgi:putative DNA primase/helicase